MFFTSVYTILHIVSMSLSFFVLHYFIFHHHFQIMRSVRWFLECLLYIHCLRLRHVHIDCSMWEQKRRHLQDLESCFLVSGLFSTLHRMVILFSISYRHFQRKFRSGIRHLHNIVVQNRHTEINILCRSLLIFRAILIWSMWIFESMIA